MIRIGFTPIGGENWTGGFYYLKNLLTALSLSESCTIEPVVLSGLGVPEDMEAALAAISGVEFHQAAISANQTRSGRLMRALTLGRDPVMQSLIEQYRLDAVFESAEFFGWRLGVPAIAWIPDFQHRLLRDQFSYAAYWRRELGFRAQIASGRTIMFSSNDSMNTCLNHYAVARERVALVRFAVMAKAPADPAVARRIADSYGLPERFFYLPNQFWQHKNHLLVVEALEMLRRDGVEVVVAASGRPMDPRHPGHFPALQRRISESGVSSQFRVLGMIPHDHLMALMCASDAVLNPSLSEGWSTTVEEARSQGVPLILSDLPVHKEQAGTGAVYFDRHDAGSLANVLRMFGPLALTDRLHAAHAARASARERVAQFSKDFESAVHQAVTSMQKPA